jgi:predicted HAD superfamily Cof-like phosphohydrolase
MSYDFYADIDKFNAMYGLPMPSKPTTALEPILTRQPAFKKVLSDEVAEVDDIIELASITDSSIESELNELVAMADWLGDLVVYATSEARRYGIPLQEVLAIIMQSNFSKLGADGRPIISGDKVQKGPSYWKPEPQIKELLKRHMGSKDVGH